MPKNLCKISTFAFISLKSILRTRSTNIFWTFCIIANNIFGELEILDYWWNFWFILLHPSFSGNSLMICVIKLIDYNVTPWSMKRTNLGFRIYIFSLILKSIAIRVSFLFLFANSHSTTSLNFADLSIWNFFYLTRKFYR